jgi:hypothetical protein
MTIQEILQLIGVIVRALGALVFGVGVGWFTLQALEWNRDHWQFAVAAYLGLLGTFALIGHWTSGAGTLGGFGLGAGLALLIWGMRGRGSSESGGGSSEPARTVMK